MLVLPHANRFGFNLHQFGQRVLQAARNAGGAAQADIHIGHFLAGVFACAIDRGTGLAHHYLVYRRCIGPGHGFDKVRRQRIGFAAGGAVTDRNQADIVLGAQCAQGMQRAVPVAARLVGKHGGGIDQFAGGIDHGDFYTRAYAGVQPHHHARACGCRQQQITDVVGKHFDSHFFCVFPQTGKQVAL